MKYPNRSERKPLMVPNRIAGADPGFPVAGDADPLWGANMRFCHMQFCPPP